MAREELYDERREPQRFVRSAQRLDVPRDTRRVVVPRPTYDPDTFGRFAETFARFMGTARFLMYMTGFVIVWITLNVVGIYGLKWDAYPFILLNLFFSTQASYAAPLILLAQNRQESRDRVMAERDREANARALADQDFLAREVASLRMAIGEVATRDFLRSELRGLLADIDDLTDRADPADRAGDDRGGDDDRGRVADPPARGRTPDPQARGRTPDPPDRPGPSGAHRLTRHSPDR